MTEAKPWDDGCLKKMSLEEIEHELWKRGLIKQLAHADTSRIFQTLFYWYDEWAKAANYPNGYVTDYAADAANSIKTGVNDAT